MTTTKRKISVSIDEELVAELEASDEPVSAQVNSALRDQLAHRRRQRLLREWLDQMEAEDGPLDETEVQTFMDLLR
ncbi:MAG: type II toxin-antitoxin system CcdA family antitoxin [Iamia sp.]